MIVVTDRTMPQPAKKKLHAKSLRVDLSAERGVDMDVVVHETIDSTNSWSLQQCKAGKALPFACFAETQASGRGRRGKHWVMPAYENIAMSLAWPFQLQLEKMHLLPLSISMAIVETLESFNLDNVQVKWPNDVYVSGKKIAGILIETRPVKNEQIDIGCADEKHAAVVIGVGLNYDMSALMYDEAIELPAFTDICSEFKSGLHGEGVVRTEVASVLLRQVVKVCQSFQLDPGRYLARFRSRYDYCKEKGVEVILDDGEVLTGVAQGVNDNAELLVLVDGQQRSFNSAEVSVKV